MVLSKKYDIHISYFYIMHSPHFSLCSHPHMTSSRPIYPPPALIVTMAKGTRIFRVSAPHVDKKIQVSCYLFSFPYHVLTSLWAMPTSSHYLLQLNQHLSCLASDCSERNGEFQDRFLLSWYYFHYSHFVPIS